MGIAKQLADQMTGDSRAHLDRTKEILNSIIEQFEIDVTGKKMTESMMGMVNSFLERESLHWTHEPLERLHHHLLEASTALGELTAPGTRVMWQLIELQGRIIMYMYEKFETIDEKIITPAWEYISNNWDTLGMSVVENAGDVWEFIYEKLELEKRIRIGRRMFLDMGAFADNKFQLAEHFATGVEVARQMDAEVTGGYLENDLLWPFVEFSREMDDMYAEGKVWVELEKLQEDFVHAKEAFGFYQNAMKRML